MMRSSSKDKARLGLAVFFILASIVTFVYGFLERQAGNDFNQIWTLALIMLFGSMVHLQKLGNSKKRKKNNILCVLR